ncbi:MULTISPECIES: gas vesicle protein [Streptomyces]|uniref:Putative gas vesicle synthesis protein n=1 Tax=Streptomyces venezuelae (strain ATCC 10712 / CBS 650.69 / DSM 40230 / JCM 4526 / NBRC 13096 / PD 04745) TaxID=953739 RepID=F2R6X8_STRVP|nr:gas vesicle protein [Streptomyces venezuelae]APE19857.1 gas vesicle protein [Streptomyces venezuelae]QER97267.1 gas vesicle protein [Streptomyces venezuelae ATCC 10712]CCA53670.1 putative gas vesicle synthesis protein [Streptomyces venezuelae ATCC 10712]
MSESFAGRLPASPHAASPSSRQGSSANLADILERVLDKGIVIAGDIQINLLDIELLTIKLRLLVASVDKAKEMGIDWWEHDPSLSSRARPPRQVGGPGAGDGASREEVLADENERLRAELVRLRAAGPSEDGPEPEPEEATRRGTEEAR